LKYLVKALEPTQRKALKKRLRGKVVIAFILNKEGKPEECRVIKGINPEIDEEVMSAVKNMPSWSPPTLPDGRVVKMQMSLPVTFDFED
jgi:periplasmic protein TonB